jgi:toxin ParE1/3/4
MRLVWTRPAARDLEAIGDYIARENPTAAGRIIQRIHTRTQDLVAHPDIGRTGRVGNTRELVITSTRFIVVYRVGKETVEMLAVFHSARRWPETF